MATLLGIPVGSISPVPPGRRIEVNDPIRVSRRDNAGSVDPVAALVDAKSLHDVLRSHGNEHGWGAYRSLRDDPNALSRAVTVWMRVVFMVAGAPGGEIQEAEARLRWLDTPSHFLGGATPFQALLTDTGFALAVAWISISGCSNQPPDEYRQSLRDCFVDLDNVLSNSPITAWQAKLAVAMVKTIDGRELAAREILACRRMPDSEAESLAQTLMASGWEEFTKRFQLLIASCVDPPTPEKRSPATVRTAKSRAGQTPHKGRQNRRQGSP